MSGSNSSAADHKPRKTRRDGWTPARQILFLDLLARTGSVTSAASGDGMSRESAHRLRERPGAELFAGLWDKAFDDHSGRSEAHFSESHMRELTDGQLVRLLGRHFPGKLPLTTFPADVRRMSKDRIERELCDLRNDGFDYVRGGRSELMTLQRSTCVFLRSRGGKLLLNSAFTTPSLCDQ